MVICRVEDMMVTRCCVSTNLFQYMTFFPDVCERFPAKRVQLPTDQCTHVCSGVISVCCTPQFAFSPSTANIERHSKEN